MKKQRHAERNATKWEQKAQKAHVKANALYQKALTDLKSAKITLTTDGRVATRVAKATSKCKVINANNKLRRK